MLDIPLGLRTVLESGTAVLFIGAGIGWDATDPDGDPAPDGTRLAEELAAKFGIDNPTEPDLAKVAQIVELRKGRAELLGFLTKRLSDLEPNDSVRWIASRRWGAIFTTNYDRVIERAYELEANPPQMLVPMSSTSELVETDPRFEVPLYHVHGALFTGNRPDILITQNDYARFAERRRMLFEILKQRFATTPFLYLGYSQRDPNWRTLQDEMRSEFSPRQPPRSYRVDPKTDQLDAEILRSMDIDTISAFLPEFVAAASATVGAPGDNDRLKQIEQSVPRDLLPAFRENPAATARLLSSWDYVNAAPFDEAVDLPAYLAGDLPNWGLIASGATFERDIEEPLHDALLDYATSDDSRPTSTVVLGSAGYGVSTVLMKAAAQLVREDAGPVFMHRRGTPLVEGDIEFATSTLNQRPFFVIDNASDWGSEVISAVRRLRDTQQAACFVLGERLNEWRQRHWRLSPIEFEIEPLSDKEIRRLLDFLEKHAALHALSDLTPELRVAAIKEKHEKQLLVAMREATEGKAFDAIIEDEFRSIEGEEARTVYAAVCASYRLRVPVRMEALATALDIGLADVYDTVGPGLAGIVRIDTIDESKGLYAARARHQVIAEIIWERVLEPAERDRLAFSALDALNLSYVLDARAFEAFVRDDRGVDAIGSFEGKVQYFERATRKDPDNPYVLQHYARMLLRAGKPELALGVIDSALKLDSKVRVLRHTKGLVLRHLALSAESTEIGRRRLAQSEAALRESFGPQKRDPYVFQALAELYLGWAGRTDADEAAEYVTKAEDTIREGLLTSDDREGLWLVSAKVQDFLGNRPEALDALRRAVRESPTSTVARYLLARALFRDRSWTDVIETLDPVLEHDPNEYRCAVLYARALERLGEPYAKATAVLQLASLYGRRDPRYVATLGGMLTMQGEFTAAEKMFAESRTFTYRDANRIEYEPRASDEDTTPLDGTVINPQPGYAFIQVPGFPDFFVPGRNFGGLELRRGLRVRFRPAFTPRGGVATSLTEIPAGASVDVSTV